MSSDREEPKNNEPSGRPSSWRDVSSVIGEVDGLAPAVPAVAPSKMLGPDELAAMMKRSEPELAPLAPPGLGEPTVTIEAVRGDAPVPGTVPAAGASSAPGSAPSASGPHSGSPSAPASVAGGQPTGEVAAGPAPTGLVPPRRGGEDARQTSAAAASSPVDAAAAPPASPLGVPAHPGAWAPPLAPVLEPVGRDASPTSTAASLRDEARPATSVSTPAAPRETFAWVPGEVKLVIEQGLSIGKEFLVSDNEMLVGRRDPEQDFIPDIDLFDQETANNRYISRRQARLYFRDMRLYLEDLESSNGTAINNKLVAAHEPRVVNLNDKLLFGQSVLLRVKRL